MSQTQTSSQSNFPSRVPVFLPGGVNRDSLGFGILCFLIGGAIMAGGCYWIVIQRHRILTYLPVNATIIDSRVETSGRGSKRSLIPRIAYRYFVHGAPYQCSRVRASGDTSFEDYVAKDLVAKHPVGSALAVWYDPSDPSSGYFIREVEAAPYLIAIAPLFFPMLGVYAIVISIRARRPRPVPTLDATRWYRVCEEGTIRSRSQLNAIGVIFWYGYGGALIADYLYLNRGFDWGALFLVWVAFLGGVLFVMPLLRNRKLSHEFLDADVHISEPQIRLGDSFQVRMLQELIRSLNIECLSLGLFCIREKVSRGTKGSSTVVTEEAWSQWKDLTVNRTYQPGSQLEAEGSFTIPPTGFATTPWPSRIYPRYRWQMAIGIVATGQARLEVRFPIDVEPEC